MLKHFVNFETKDVPIGSDVALLLDEMHLQQQVQYDGQDIIGCDENLEIFKSILCFMVISLRKTVPYIIKAVPIVKYPQILSLIG